MFHVSAKTFGFNFRSGEGGSARGMKKLDSHPQAAKTTMAAEITKRPFSVRMITPPRMVPIKIARNVPASISAFPPMSSSS